jgi:hypothetical protein
MGGVVGGCAGAAEVTPSAALQPQAAVAAPSVAQREAAADARVNVAGIEGTFSAYDVNRTVEGHAEAFAACHEPRARRIPPLGGRIAFGIEVAHSGEVKRVVVRHSDVGDRVLEQCFSDVIRAVQFPRPNGGDADVSWTTEISPPWASREPEVWDAERVKRVASKRSARLRERCELPRRRRVNVTAYVNRRGRVIAASVAPGAAHKPEQLDCIVDTLRSWTMPRPRKRRWAKVSFAIQRSAT